MRFTTPSFLAWVVTFLACEEAKTGLDGRVGIIVSALELPGVGGACYDVSVTNGAGQLLWSFGDPSRRAPADPGAVCGQDLGVSGGGLTYFGPCDGASPQTNVTLYLDSLWAPGADREVDAPLTGWVNPCPSPGGCTLTTTCAPGGDVSAVFDLTVLREGDRGFFDISVGLDEVFCTAQVDCKASGDFGPEPLTLLHDPLTGHRVPSVALRFACTAGAERQTHLLLDAELRCGATTLRLPLGGEPGNIYTALNREAPLVQAATYRGLDQSANPLGQTAGLLYFNTLLALDFAALTDMCHLRATLSATAGRPLPTFSTPAATSYPVIRVFVPLAGPGAADYTCSNSRIGSGPPEGLWVDSVREGSPERFRFLAYELEGGVVVETRPEYRLQSYQVAAALRAESTSYSLVMTAGQSSPFAYSAGSSSYEVQGGLVSRLTEDSP